MDIWILTYCVRKAKLELVNHTGPRLHQPDGEEANYVLVSLSLTTKCAGRYYWLSRSCGGGFDNPQVDEVRPVEHRVR